MKQAYSLLFFCLISSAMFWNLENFFDFRDDTGADDRVMRKKAFYSKCDLVAKTIFWAGDRYGMPDVIGVAEVENDFVMKSVISSTNLWKLGYKFIHFESADRRGIDTGLFYKGRLESHGRLSISMPDGSPLKTRDLLWAVLEDGTAVVVCHLPSKYGGARESAPKRAAATTALCSLTDSLRASGHRVIIMGDFNDTPESEVFAPLGERAVNMASPLASRGEGTIKYNGRWELIDMFWLAPACITYTSDGYHEFRRNPDISADRRGTEKISPETAQRNKEKISPEAEMVILRPPFLLETDRRGGGVAPHRTYKGPRYIGGASDHLPIMLLNPQ